MSLVGLGRERIFQNMVGGAQRFHGDGAGEELPAGMGVPFCCSPDEEGAAGLTLGSGGG